jgi:hypothetical protein
VQQYAAVIEANSQMQAHGTALEQQLRETQAREAQLTAQLSAARAAVAAATAAASAPKVLRVKAPPITPFTGTGGNLGAVVDTWLEDLQQTFDYYGATDFPDDATKLRLATTYLRSGARTWWATASKQTDAHGRPAIATWADFVAALHRRYRPALPAELARRKLKDLKQRGNVNSYAGLFQQLLAYIPNKSEEDALFDFRCGLDKAIAARVAEKDPKTLDEAIMIAVQAELYVGRNAGAGYSSFGNRSAPPSNHTSSSSAPMDLNNVNAEFDHDGATTDPSDHDESSAPAAPTDHLLAAVLSKFESLEARLNALSSSRSAPKSSGAPKAKSSSAPSKAPTKLTDAERDRCHRENRCLRCREKGHWSNECPVYGSKRLNA